MQHQRTFALPGNVFAVCLIAASLALGVGMSAARAGTWRSEEGAPLPARASAVALRPAAAFADIGDRTARAIALFREAGKVIQSPRCMNCHPRTDRPTQTDAMRPHQPLALRGVDGHGPVGGVNCKTCHGAANYDRAGVPGNPKWGLAPATMAWQGKSLGQICLQLKDRNRNGGKDLPALVKHFGEDDLVGWAWHPGGGRVPAPGTQAALGKLIAAWVDAGATCPPVSVR